MAQGSAVISIAVVVATKDQGGRVDRLFHLGPERPESLDRVDTAKMVGQVVHSGTVRGKKGSCLP